DELESQILASGRHFAEISSGKTNPTELIALLIVEGKDFVDGIENVFRHIKGSCSMLILTDDGSIIAARDKLGRTPIVMGKKEGAYAVSSETTAFPNLGYEILRDVGPGEIVRIYDDRIIQMRRPDGEMQICSFLWVYYGFPTSTYEGCNVEQMRYASGMAMGARDKTEVDCVCGIPDSGIGMALGYAQGMGVPYRRAISKYTPTWPRSFTPGDQSMRELVARMKLVPNRAILDGKRVLFCDDSIVRGTQLRDNVKELYHYGAREVHVRVACPPLIHACPFVNFSASKNVLELITRRIIKELEGDENANLEAYTDPTTPEYSRMVEMLAERFGLSSLKFNTIETIVEAIGLPKKCICTHCFDGSSHF
ncbi:MAG: amidophosphoribosyltransferase, partial [Muribaculaceae bacterium]|nr:amidophosphoribosyltransferase [Muribaculaceae bacterium]